MSSLATEAVTAIKADILNGVYQPCEKLKLTEMKHRYQVGMSPVREALFTLSLTGLVSNEAQKGFIVSALNKKDLKDLYHVRTLTDCEAIRLSCLYGDTAWEANILASFHQLENTELDVSKIAFTEWDKTHRQFHMSLIAGCDSAHLIQLFNLYYDQALRYRAYWFKSQKTKNINLKNHHLEHKKLMQAVLNRNSEKACTLLQGHYASIVKKLIKLL